MSTNKEGTMAEKTEAEFSDNDRIAYCECGFFWTVPTGMPWRDCENCDEAPIDLIASYKALAQQDQGTGVGEAVVRDLVSDEHGQLHGPLGEAIAEEAGNYSLEFVMPEQIAQGFVAWLNRQPPATPEPQQEEGGVGEALTRIEVEALLNRRMGGTAEEIAELEEARVSGREKLWNALRADQPMKLKISGGGDPAGMNDAIYANEPPATPPPALSEQGEAAVEAAARAPFDHAGSDEYWDALDEDDREATREDVRLMLTAALPAIEQAVEERVRERLFGKEAEKLLAARLYEEDQRRLGFPRRRLDKASNGPQRTYHARAFAHLAALSQPHNTEEEK